LRGFFFGPIYSVAIGGLGDVISSYIMPLRDYFWGFTVSVAIYGLVYGLMLYRNPNKEFNKRNFIIKLVISNIIVALLIDIFLTPVWLSMVFGRQYMDWLIPGVWVQIVLCPLQIIVMYGLDKVYRPYMEKRLYERE
jgi:ECF transporter S component (folate family)